MQPLGSIFHSGFLCEGLFNPGVLIKMGFYKKYIAIQSNFLHISIRNFSRLCIYKVGQCNGLITCGDIALHSFDGGLVQ